MNLVKKAAQDALMEAMRRGISAICDETRDDAKFRDEAEAQFRRVESFSGMSLVAGHSNRMGAVFPRGIQRNDEQGQAALLDRLGIVLPKRMRFAEHERPALAASA
jgi:hypothetical protein